MTRETGEPRALLTELHEHRDDYYHALRTADASSDCTDWLIFFLGGFAFQMFLIQELARSAANPKESE